MPQLERINIYLPDYNTPLKWVKIVQGDCCDHPQLGFPYIKQCDSKYLKWSRTCFLHNLLLFGLHGSAAVCMMAWWCGVFVLSNWCIQQYSRRQTATNKAQDSFPLSITLFFIHSFCPTLFLSDSFVPSLTLCALYWSTGLQKSTRKLRLGGVAPEVHSI